MSVESHNATPPGPAIAPGAETIQTRQVAETLAARNGGPVDSRIRALVPDFDAPFFQAGLAGYSDAPMRLIARRHGCPFCVTEALLDRTLLAGGRGFVKADLGEIQDNVPGGELDHPLAGQIMGSDPQEMAAAAIKMMEQGRRADKEYRKMAYAVDGVFPTTAVSSRQHLRLPGGEQLPPFDPSEGLEDSCQVDLAVPELADGEGRAVTGKSFEVIDVNLACPVKKIDKKARGGHWLTEPQGAIAILEAVREAMPKNVVCAVKIRRSYDDTPEMVDNFHKIFEACYKIGYAWTTVHARTVEQKYVGPSRWTFLKDLTTRYPEAVVFGSGDIWNADDIFRMLQYTGVHAVSVARGCIGNPWIFRQARDMMAGRPARKPTIAEQKEVLLSHFELALAAGGGLFNHREQSTAMTMRKFGIRFAEHHPRKEDVRKRFIAVNSLVMWKAVLEEWYQDE